MACKRSDKDLFKPAKEKTQERVTEATNFIVEAFTTGNLPEMVAQTVILRDRFWMPSAKWSLGNQLIMLMQSTTDARGFNQWKEVGRSVIKGAKAFYILGPSTKTITEKDNKGTESKKSIVVGFHAVPVFRFEDTDGMPLEGTEEDLAPPDVPPLYDVAMHFGLKVEYLPFLGKYRGFYQPGRDRIGLCTHDWEVFFHELAHAAHHKVKGNMKGGQDKDQEIVAETVAAALCHLYGADGYVYHGAEYVQSYAKGENPGKAVMKVLADVQKTMSLILDTAADLVEVAPALAS